MSDLLKYLAEDDPLKTASKLIQDTNFGPSENDIESPISFSLLAVCSLLLALTKTLYGDAGYTFLQHFFSSIVLVFVGYVVLGLFLMLIGLKYSSVNNKMRCFLTCFMATIVVSLLFIYFADAMTRFAVNVTSNVSSSDSIISGVGDAFPAVVFSLIGSVAVFALRVERGQKYGRPDVSWLRRLRTFPVYLLFTTVVFYFLAIDRDWFFNTVMKQISQIKIA